MVSTATIVTCTISLVVCLFLPVVGAILFARKNKGQKISSAWLLGAAGFFITQIVIRVPILTWMQTQTWFLAFSQQHLFLYAFLLAFTAGLFELAGRYAVAQLMKKNLTFPRSLAAGLGHGGIEAMLLIGASYITNLAFIVMINTGSFDSVISEAAAAGVDASQLYAIQDTLISSSPALFLLGGFERLLAMTTHAAMSVIVCHGLYSGKPLRGALICLGIHTLLDLTAGISLLIGTALTQTTAYIIIYAILMAAALISVVILRRIRRSWPETEVSYDF